MHHSFSSNFHSLVIEDKDSLEGKYRYVIELEEGTLVI